MPGEWGIFGNHEKWEINGFGMEWLVPENQQIHFQLIFAMFKLMDLAIPETWNKQNLNGIPHLKMELPVLKWVFHLLGL